MKSDKLIAILLPSVIVVILFVTVFNPAKRNRSNKINSFEDCVAAGNPVLESYPRQCNTKDGKHFVENLESPVQNQVSSTPTPFDENWQSYTNQEMGISFPYPTDYKLNENVPQSDSYYISLISPLDSDKPVKQTSLNEKELKIEIITEPALEEDSSKKCFYDHTEDPNVLDQREVTISGVKAMQFDWQGLGDGQFTCVIKNETRYMINKYPLVTDLQSYYRIILENLTISP